MMIVRGYETPATPVTLKIGNETLVVSPQQMMELGALCLALAGVAGIDYESADALLEGFCLKGKQAAKNLAKALSE